MDELHILLLAALSAQANDSSLLGQVFSLPNNVVVKELAALKTYGLAQEADDAWLLQVGGQQLTAVWNALRIGPKPRYEPRDGDGSLDPECLPWMK